VADALLTSAPSSRALRLNRVTGLGTRSVVTEKCLDQILAFYRSAGARRFCVMLSPGPRAAATARRLVARGFQSKGGHVLLVRDCRNPIPPARPRVRVAKARRGEAETVHRIQQRAFGDAPGRAAWVLAAIRAGETEHYLARVGRTPVAAGALRIDGDLAWLGGGATLPRWRRHGAHGALIAARLRRAARCGCRWVWVEAALPHGGRPSASHRNLLRVGFEEAGPKPTFVWSER